MPTIFRNSSILRIALQKFLICPDGDIVLLLRHLNIAPLLNLKFFGTHRRTRVGIRLRLLRPTGLIISGLDGGKLRGAMERQGLEAAHTKALQR